MIPKGQTISSIGRSKLAHERQKTSLAEPLASKGRLHCTGKNFTDFVKNGVFQQYPPLLFFTADVAEKSIPLVSSRLGLPDLCAGQWHVPAVTFCEHTLHGCVCV